MKLFSFCIWLLCFTHILNSQTCLPGGITFTSQAEIDAFPVNYPGCDQIEGNVIVDDLTNGTILNIDSLQQLISISGTLSIRNNNALLNLDGLINLTSVTGSIDIRYNDALLNLAGLNNLSSIGYSLIIQDNDQLTNLEGLSSITTIPGFLNIDYNDALQSLQGLESLSYVGESMHVDFNSTLPTLSGLEGLSVVQGGFTIHNSPVENLLALSSLEAVNGLFSIYLTSLTNLSGMNSLTHVGSLILNNVTMLAGLGSGLLGVDSIPGNITITNNPGIQDLDGLDSLRFIGGNLQLSQNESLMNLSGLEKLVHIAGDMNIANLQMLSSFNGLNALQKIGGSLFVQQFHTGNAVLADFTGFNALERIEGGFYLSNLFELTSLNGLGNLERIAGDFIISNTEDLVDFNGLTSLSKVGGTLRVVYTYDLTDVNLSALDTVGIDIDLRNNVSLSYLSGYNSLSFIGGNVLVEDNSALDSISGFNELISIDGNLNIHGNFDLKKISGFNAIMNINGSLKIAENDALKDITAFNNLENISGNFELSQNHLKNLTAFSSLESIDGILTINEAHRLKSLAGLENIDPASITHLNLTACDSLNICSFENICSYLEDGGPAIVYNNDAGCANIPVVQFYCNPMPPTCTSLISPANGVEGVELDVNLTWALSPPVTTGYILDIGITPGGSELLDSFNVFNTSVYNPPFTFPPSTTIYVTISPYNAFGENTSCAVDSFTTTSQASWIGGTGMWNVASNWDIQAIPNDTTRVVINDGTVTIPSSYAAVAGSVEIQSTGELHLDTNAVLSINDPFINDALVLLDSALLLNHGSIHIGNLNFIPFNGIRVVSSGQILNDTSGIIHIDQITGSAQNALIIDSYLATMINHGQIIIGGVNSLQGNGITCVHGGTMINGLSGVIKVDNIAGLNKDAIHIEQYGQLVNGGNIMLGSTAPINRYGISVTLMGSMTNQLTGSIFIDRVPIGCYFFGSGVNVINDGNLKIGSVAPVSNTGMLNSGFAHMTNDSAGTVWINQAPNGLWLDNTGLFTNDGYLRIGNISPISSTGLSIYSGADLVNDDDGIIEINRSVYALWMANTGSSFSNYGIFNIGNTAACNYGISTLSSAQFINLPLGQILINNIITQDGIQSLSSSLFNNYGSIKIGNEANINRYGMFITSGADFINQNGSMFEINRCLNTGIFMNTSGSTFSNSGNLKIGNTSFIFNIGIDMSSSCVFTNFPTGSVEINNSTGYSAMVVNNLATVNNSGTIKLGNLFNIDGGIIMWASAKFNNLSGSSLEINRLSWVGLLVDQSGTLFTNDGNFKIGNLIQSNAGINLTNGGDFINTGIGSIEVDRISDFGIQLNHSGSFFTNNGLIKIGATATIANSGINVLQSSTFTNSSTGSIQVNNCNVNWWTKGLLVSSASFSNSGVILAGNSQSNTSPVYLEAAALFTNFSTGNITIDLATNAGIELVQAGTIFTNHGAITIGSNGIVGTHGIQLGQSTSFTNAGTGNIQINNININWWSRGIALSAGSFTNSGAIAIGNLAPMSIGIGLESAAIFNNISTGSIQINQTIGNGIQVIHTNSNFTNQGSINLGNTGTIGDVGIHAWENGAFTNGSSGIIEINRANPNWWSRGIRAASAGTITNAGIIRLGNLASNNNGITADEGGIITNSIDGIINSTNAVNHTILVNLSGSSFLNHGHLFIGATGNLMENGIIIQNNSTFTNSSSGVIEINKASIQWWSKSIAVFGAALLNSGSISIGNLSTCSFGIHAEGASTLTNYSTGNITINRVTYQGIQLVHAGTSFNNSGTISTGSTHQVGDSGIGLFENSMMTNLSSGIIECNGGTTNSLSSGVYVSYGSFTNDGLIRAGNISSINVGIRVGNTGSEIGMFTNRGIIEIDRIPNTTYLAALNVVIGSTFNNEVNGVLKMGLNQNVQYGMYGGGTISNYGLIQARYVINGTIDFGQPITNYSGAILEGLAPGRLIVEVLGTLNNNAGAIFRSQPGAFLDIRGRVNNYGTIEAQ